MLTPETVVVPEPVCVTLPVPEIAPATAKFDELLKTSEPLSVILPLWNAAPGPPVPICRVPAMVVEPV